MKQEIIEIRRLVAKAESLICSKPNNVALCEQAESIRSIIHEKEDPRTLLLGIEKLDKLIQEMAANNIAGFEKLQKELKAFKETPEVQQVLTSPTNISFRDAQFAAYSKPYMGSAPANPDDTTHEDLVQPATTILNRLRRDWHIGPYFVPLTSAIEMPNRADWEMLFSKWYDSTYKHINQCIEVLSRGFEGLGMHSTWMRRTVRTFDVLRIACQLALEIKDPWGPPLIRLLIVAAHELRLSGSSGMHGSDRLGAKLVVGKLIGNLSQYDLDSALILADLTIESISFSRSQVLYAQGSNPEALRRLIERWHQDEKPMCRDIVAQTYVFGKKVSKAREILYASKEYLQTAQDRCYSSSTGEYFVKSYSEHLEDIYLARLSRTLALIDAEEALLWCDEIATPEIRIASYLHILLNNPQLKGKHVASNKRELSQILGDPRFNPKDFWLPTYELRYLPYLKVYPEFPAERWEDLMECYLPSRESILETILNIPQ